MKKKQKRKKKKTMGWKWGVKIGKELLDQSAERGKKRVGGRLKRLNETGMR